MFDITNDTIDRFLDLCRRKTESGINIVISGHDIPDPDSIISAVLLKKLLDKSGICSSVCFSTKTDKLTQTTCKRLISSFDTLKFGFEENEYTDKCELILVDHHVNNHVLPAFACIDHHTTPPSPVLEQNIVIKASSCGRIINYMMECLGINDKESDLLALYSIYTDTVSCRSLKYDKRDDEWRNHIIYKYGVDEKWLQRVGMMLNDPNENARDLTDCALKKYSFSGGMGASNVLQVDDEAEEIVSCRFDEIKSCIEERMKEEGYSIWAYVISNIESCRAIVYFLIFDGKTTHINNTVHLDRIASRSRDVIPVVSSYLESLIKQ